MEECVIDDKTAILLAGGIAGNRSLTVVDLSNNR